MMIATRNGDNAPSTTRAYGCSATSSSLILYICRPESEREISNLEATGDIAATFSLPTTYETYQLKGRDAVLQDLSSEDHDAIERYYSVFFAQISVIGLTEAGIEGLAKARLVNDFIGVKFTPTDIFRQTPGPGAGERRPPQ